MIVVPDASVTSFLELSVEILDFKKWLALLENWFIASDVALVDYA